MVQVEVSGVWAALAAGRAADAVSALRLADDETLREIVRLEWLAEGGRCEVIVRGERIGWVGGAEFEAIRALSRAPLARQAMQQLRCVEAAVDVTGGGRPQLGPRVRLTIECVENNNDSRPAAGGEI